ncbi:uncharacterized protein EI90DRAFT_3043929 [Cantharellus anzutake]|uniref:uncharacterized protein n=1 Tax=Cantharellus anzutake TaxID=1750568 RepID=UPI0019068174|nr:uncharacterized protein EI90DRAFT_3043929 [Cantharellus anzutake]KAF8336868.1 hypothetical protein EI90DRAFT_3043929 [Cantharellus anzutake]
MKPKPYSPDIHFSCFPYILLDIVGEMRNLRFTVSPHPIIMKMNWEVNKHIAEFFSKVPSDLEELDLEDLTADICVSIFTHSLKRLSLHSYGDFNRAGTRQVNRTRPVISAQQLDEMCVSCTLLEELEIDINRDGEWPHDILDKVAKFPCLKKLTLSLEVASVQLYKYIASQRTFGPSVGLIITPDFEHRLCGSVRSLAYPRIEQHLRTYKVAPCCSCRGLVDVWTERRDCHPGTFYGPVGGNTEDDKRFMKSFAKSFVQSGPVPEPLRGTGTTSLRPPGRVGGAHHGQFRWRHAPTDAHRSSL